MSRLVSRLVSMAARHASSSISWIGSTPSAALAIRMPMLPSLSSMSWVQESFVRVISCQSPLDCPRNFCMNDQTSAMSNDATANGAATSQSNGKTGLSDAIRAHFAGNAPLTEKAKGFAKARPWTSAAFLGVAAIAVLNTLRGRR